MCLFKERLLIVVCCLLCAIVCCVLFVVRCLLVFVGVCCMLSAVYGLFVVCSLSVFVV